MYHKTCILILCKSVIYNIHYMTKCYFSRLLIITYKILKVVLYAVTRIYLTEIMVKIHCTTTTTTTTVLWPFFWDHLGEPVREQNLWSLWCKERLTDADTPTIRLGATPSGLNSAHLHDPPIFTGQMPFLPPNQQCQSTEGN